MTIGEKIKFLRIKSNLTQEELANYANTTKQTIHKYETGIITNIPANKIKAISEKLGTTPAYLMGWETENDNKSYYINLPPPTITEDYSEIPVSGGIAAGYNRIAYENWEGETVPIPNHYLKGHNLSDYFVLNVNGSSMYPMYQDGDQVLILRQSTLNHSGQVGAILYNDEFATLKKVEYVMGEDWLKLVPINPNYEPELIEGEALEHCRVMGIPKLLIRDIKG